MEFLSGVVKSTADTFHNSLYMSITISLVTLLSAILGYYLIRDKGLPPGPTGIPLLGYWPFLKKDIRDHQQVRLVSKYGDIYSFRVTGKLFINLASKKVLREAYITKSDCFMERTSDFAIISRIIGNGILYSRGEKWQTTRKFFLHQFKERGMSIYKENTAEAMNETVDTFVEELRKLSDQPIDIHEILSRKINCVIRQTLFGPQTTITESEIQNLQEKYRMVTSLIHSTNLVLIGNIAKYLVTPFLPFYKEGFRIHKDTMKMLMKMIDDHKKTFDGHNIRDIIDSFIEEGNQRKLKGDPTAEYFNDETLADNLIQFIGDGVSNVATFITRLIVAFLSHPEEQEKIYKELVDVCGEDRNPTLTDRSKLTYTNAFIMEVQRSLFSAILFPSLECTKETTIGGYRIPKGAITVINFYAINMDPKEHDEPEKFNPNRFISKDGKPREDSPVTFGVGKKSCPGESFVLMQVFLFIIALVKNFKISYYRSDSQFEWERRKLLMIRVTPRK